MVYYSGEHGTKYYPPSEIGRDDGQSEVTIQTRDHDFKPVILGGRHGWRCRVCGYEEIGAFFGKTPQCPGKKS